MKITTLLLLCVLASTNHAFAQAKKNTNPNFLLMALVNTKSFTSESSNAASNKANIQANIKRHMDFIDRLTPEGVEFFGFPEMSINGYRFGNFTTWLKLDGPEVKAFLDKAKDKGIYISVGLAEVDADGKKWNTQIVIDPKGDIVGKHHKISLVAEKGITEAGTEHKVFDVKGMKMGIALGADGADRKNLQALVDNGAQIIYAPSAAAAGGTTVGWSKSLAAWGGDKGWIAELKVYAALHNQAGWFHPEFNPPTTKDSNSGWASGAWFIGPDGKTIKQMPPSNQKTDNKEFVLVASIPIKKK